MLKETMGLWTGGLSDATFGQRMRVFAAEQLGIGPWCTRLAVRAEIKEAAGFKDDGPLADVSAVELIDVLTKIEEAPDGSQRYQILAEPIPDKAQPTPDSPLVWFDIIHGLTAPHIIKSVGQAAFELASGNGGRWENGLDVGTGTGNVAAVLLGRTGVPRSVENLVTVDREPSLLAIAHRRYPEAAHVEGDATALQFPDASFDLITSGGLAYSLDYDSQTKFFREVSRVLAPGGVYLDGDYRNAFVHPDNVHVGPKHGLESFIVSYIAPKEIAPPSIWKEYLELSGEQVQMYGPDDFGQFGLEYETREYRGPRANEITDVRVLQKVA
jgi:ubiquinone/menaquinone biosynthesis C-methylase UbiE